MYSEKKNGIFGRLFGFSQVTPPSGDLNRELIDLLKESQKNQNELLREMISAQKVQNQTLGEWIGLFKPSGVNKSTSLDERGDEKDALDGIPEQWDPIDPRELEEIFKGLE